MKFARCWFSIPLPIPSNVDVRARAARFRPTMSRWQRCRSHPACGLAVADQPMRFAGPHRPRFVPNGHGEGRTPEIHIEDGDIASLKRTVAARTTSAAICSEESNRGRAWA